MKRVRARGVNRLLWAADAAAIKLGKTVGVAIRVVATIVDEVMAERSPNCVAESEFDTALKVTGACCMLRVIFVKVTSVLCKSSDLDSDVEEELADKREGKESIATSIVDGSGAVEVFKLID